MANVFGYILNLIMQKLYGQKKNRNFAVEFRNLWRDMAAREYCDIVELFLKL